MKKVLILAMTLVMLFTAASALAEVAEEEEA